MSATSLSPLIAAVRAALEAMEAEYARMPFFVRPMVRRGFAQRTGADLEGWRARLAAAERGTVPPGLVGELERLRAHFDGAPARAQRGMGARPDELRELEARAAARVLAVEALLAQLTGGAGRS
jgi:hypothetical protein